MKETLKSLLMPIFTISLILFMALGSIIVLVQLFSIVTINGNLSIKIYQSLRLWAIRFSTIAAFAGFGMSYLRERPSTD